MLPECLPNQSGLWFRVRPHRRGDAGAAFALAMGTVGHCETQEMEHAGDVRHLVPRDYPAHRDVSNVAVLRGSHRQTTRLGA